MVWLLTWLLNQINCKTVSLHILSGLSNQAAFFMLFLNIIEGNCVVIAAVLAGNSDVSMLIR